MSQSELAMKAGVCLRTVQNWEAGKGGPRGKKLRNLAAALGREIPYLLGSEIPRPAPDRSITYPDTNQRGAVYALHEEPAGEPRGKIPTEQDCRAHLDLFLELCHGDISKIGWTLHELKKHFPVPNQKDQP